MSCFVGRVSRRRNPTIRGRMRRVRPSDYAPLIRPTTAAVVRQLDTFPSINSRLPLQPPDIGDDLCHIIGRGFGNFWHISKLPVVGSDALHGRSHKRKVGMMGRLINFMHQRRPHVRPPACHAMTARAEAIEPFFPCLIFLRHRLRRAPWRGSLLHDVVMRGVV